MYQLTKDVKIYEVNIYTPKKVDELIELFQAEKSPIVTEDVMEELIDFYPKEYCFETDSCCERRGAIDGSLEYFFKGPRDLHAAMVEALGFLPQSDIYIDRNLILYGWSDQAFSVIKDIGSYLQDQDVSYYIIADCTRSPHEEEAKYFLVESYNAKKGELHSDPKFTENILKKGA